MRKKKKHNSRLLYFFPVEYAMLFAIAKNRVIVDLAYRSVYDDDDDDDIVL